MQTPTEAELLVIAPATLGYHPVEQLVAVSIRRGRLAVAVGFDLPTEGGNLLDYHGDIQALLPDLCGDGVHSVALIGYGAHRDVTTAARVVTAALSQRTIPVATAIHADNGVWRHLTCATPGCCPTAGRRYDTAAVATLTAALGTCIEPHPRAIIASLRHITGAERLAFTHATTAAVARLHTLERDAARAREHGADRTVHDAVHIHAADLIDQAADRYRAGQVAHDHLAAEVTVAMAEEHVCGHAIAGLTGGLWEQTMWTDLLRRAEPDYQANLALLLTVTALLAGRTALATIAADAALATNPDSRRVQMAHAAISHRMGHTFALAAVANAQHH
jgi:hypothetical protein